MFLYFQVEYLIQFIINHLLNRCVDSNDILKTFKVQVLKFTGTKAYLGGFRHKLTDQIYHHASVQVSVKIYAL